MKKIFTLIAMVAFALSMKADIYIVGSDPFLNWHTYEGVKMTDNGDNTYTWTGQIKGTIWFVFADGLTEKLTEGDGNDWNTFNNEYRYGPASGADQTVKVEEVVTIQRSSGGAYKFAASSEGSEYTINLDLEEMEFTIEGEAGDDSFRYFTVAGTPVSVFGTEWDPSNTENDMTQNEDGLWTLDKYRCELQEGNLSFKVVANHDWGNAWPGENFDYYIETPGIYDIHFTFDSSNYEITVAAEFLEPIPEDPARTDDLYILGEVNGNGWAPNVGVAMNTEDKNVYTAEVTTTGTNKDEGDDTEYSYFSFTSKLSEGADGWADITRHRLGAVESGYFVGADMLGIDLPLSDFGHDNSFKLASGKNYTFMVNLDELTLVITEDSGVDEIAAGKMVAGTRYYNVMGQEVSEVNGVTIVVTTYTDGSTKASKVVK